MWLKLILLSAVISAGQAPTVECNCFCVEGEERTLCGALELAEQNVDVCWGELNCALPQQDFTPQLLPDPMPGATHCRTARVWRFDYDQHRILRICDTMP